MVEEDGFDLPSSLGLELGRRLEVDCCKDSEDVVAIAVLLISRYFLVVGLSGAVNLERLYSLVRKKKKVDVTDLLLNSRRE